MQTRFVISSLLVLALALQSQAISWSNSHNNPVLDTDGNEIQAGHAYYLVSAARTGAGGGVALDRRQSSQSSIVKQHSLSNNYGTPVSFSPASNDDILIQRESPFESAIEHTFFGRTTPSSSQERTINEATDVNIRFSEMPVVWQVQESRRSPSPSTSQLRYVMIGGQPGHPGSSTVQNWFKIEQMGRSNSSPKYTIAYCPSVCESCRVECGNISIKEENEKRWLILSQQREFPFMFVKASHS